MHPIAQAFFINEPDNGVPAVIATSVDLYFKSTSQTYGVQVQIRQCDSAGNPTAYVMPGSNLILPAASINVSDDASVATNFKFPTPVILQSATSYVIIVAPVGGNPDYEIWTGVLGGTDVTTNTPIKTNNDTGTLFLSSNDIQFTAVQSERFKFNLYIAQFTSTEGTAVFTSRETDYLLVKDQIGSWMPREKCVVSNNSYDFVRLGYSANTAAFTIGETVYQSNGSATVANGVLLSMASGTIKITNATGSWTTSYQMRGGSSNANATISSVNTSVVTANGSNTVTVPFTDTLAANDVVYLFSNTRSIAQADQITSVINSTAIQVTSNLLFTDTAAMFGRVKGDGKLYATIELFDDPTVNPNRIQVTVDQVSSNATLNFANVQGQYLIGVMSGASANLISTLTQHYNAIVPQFGASAPGDTNIDFSFTGIQGDSNYTPDTTAIPLTNNIETELHDYERVLMSTSNEYTKLPSGRIGNTTLQIYANLSTTNTMISPFIDVAKSTVSLMGNAILPQQDLYGYRVTFDSNPFNVGDQIQQANSSFTGGTGTVYIASDVDILVTNVTGVFTTSNAAGNVALVSNTNVNANPTNTSFYNERLNNTNKFASRYISKSVVLSPGQDAEDIRCYLTAYRPATTDFLVYARIEHREDPDSFDTKTWSLLQQLSSPALLSSSVNTDDFVEIEYSFPVSQELFANLNSCNTSSNNITVRSTADIANGDFLYLADNASAAFDVVRVKYVVNSSVVTLTSIPTFTSSNAAVGTIPGIESTAAAFIYAANNNVVRYVSANNIVYDTYIQFAIKIVPVSETTAVFPRAQNMRAIALQV
jgi:hypothetical protein